MIGDGTVGQVPNPWRQENCKQQTKHIIGQGENKPGLDAMIIGVFTNTQNAPVPRGNQRHHKSGQA